MFVFGPSTSNSGVAIGVFWTSVSSCGKVEETMPWKYIDLSIAQAHLVAQMSYQRYPPPSPGITGAGKVAQHLKGIAAKSDRWLVFDYWYPDNGRRNSLKLSDLYKHAKAYMHTHTRAHTHTHTHTHKWMNEWMNEWLDGWMSFKENTSEPSRWASEYSRLLLEPSFMGWRRRSLVTKECAIDNFDWQLPLHKAFEHCARLLRRGGFSTREFVESNQMHVSASWNRHHFNCSFDCDFLL